jgi:hypothetical protein
MKLSDAKRDGNTVTVKSRYQFSRPGTYFPTLRVASQREGDAITDFSRVQKLGPVRVVIELREAQASP